MKIKKIIIGVVSLVLFLLIAVALAGMYKFNYLANQPGYDVDGNKIDKDNPELVACTADAMQCPDGSFVGRTGPDCEFVCPEVEDIN